MEETLEVAKQDHHHQAEQEAVTKEVAARQAEVKGPEELDNWKYFKIIIRLRAIIGTMIYFNL